MKKFDYGNLNNLPWQPVSEGASRKIFGMGSENINCQVAKIENGVKTPPHVHENNDQIAVITAGECDYYVDGKPYHMAEGSWITVPAGVEHYIHVYDSSVPVHNLDIFNPLREEYNQDYREFINKYHT